MSQGHGEAEHRGAGDQRRDVDAEFRQDEQSADDGDGRAGNDAQQRHQSAQTRSRDLHVLLRIARHIRRRQRVGSDVGIHAVLQEPPAGVDRDGAQRRDLGAAVVGAPFLGRGGGEHADHQRFGDQDRNIEANEQAHAIGNHVARHRQFGDDVARDAMHQRLEQQQGDQRRLDGGHAAGGGTALRQGGIDGRQSQQRIEGEARHPPVAGRIELELAAEARRRDHRREPGRHVQAVAPHDQQQQHGDNGHVEHDGGTGDLAVGARRCEGARRKTCQHRQQNHEVEGDEQTPRRAIVDRRYAAFRRAGAQEGPKHQIEAAPIDERVKHQRAKLASHTVGRAELAHHKPARNRQGDQGQDVEKEGAEERTQRRLAGKAIEGADAGAAQDQARDAFGNEACHDNADQQQGGSAADDLRQGKEVRAECGKLGEGKLESLGHQHEEARRRPLAGRHSLGRRGERPDTDEPADCRGAAAA